MTMDGDPDGALRRVALVAYFFPPVGGVASARTLGFVRHLPETGWEPVIIGARGSAYGLVDPSAEAHLPPSLEIHRALTPEPGHLRAVVARALGSARSTWLRAGGGSSGTAAPRPTAPSPTPGGPSAPPDAAVRRPAPTLAARIRHALWFPDDQAGWFPFALVALLRAHRKRPFEAIVSSSSPVTAHLVAGAASRLLGVPWVADFRDPWVGNPIDPPTGRIDRWRRRRLEAWIARRADRMAFATPRLRAAYARRYPGRAERFVTIENGYEAAELVGLPRADPPHGRRRRLVYAGSLYRPAELDIFLTGLGRLVEGDPTAGRRLRVTFMGAISPECRAVADAHLTDPAISDVVGFVSFLPRSEALRRLAEADGALTLLGPGPGMDVFVGAKLYDAIGLGLQVVAILPPGDARTVLASLDWGIVGDPTPDGVAGALGRFLEADPPGRPADPDRYYDRAILTRRLARLLDEITRRTTDGTSSAAPAEEA